MPMMLNSVGMRTAGNPRAPCPLWYGRGHRSSVCPVTDRSHALRNPTDCQSQSQSGGQSIPPPLDPKEESTPGYQGAESD
jgi:hypothetical protein